MYIQLYNYTFKVKYIVNPRGAFNSKGGYKVINK